MGSILGNILKWLIYAGAAGIMLLALLVGIARLFLPLVPEYQEDIRSWSAAATGFDVQFQTISASWPLAGPQLRFIDVIVSTKETGEQVFVADNLAVGISLFMLLSDQKVLLNRLSIEGSKIRVRRDADGNFLLQDRPLDEFLQLDSDQDEPLRLPDLHIELSDIDILFTDESRSEDSYGFGIEQLGIQLSDDQIKIDGEIGLAEQFGGHATISTDLPTLLFSPEPDSTESIKRRSAARVEQEWRIYFSGEELKFEEILEYALQREVPVTEAHGDATIAVSLKNRTLQGISGELDVVDIELGFAAGQIEYLEALSGQFEWSREDNNGWLLSGSEISVERRDLFSPHSDFTVAVQSAAPGGDQTIKASANFLRLQDLYPLVQVADREEFLATVIPPESSLPEDVRGDVRELRLSLQRITDAPDIFTADVQFTDLGVTGLADGMSISGISGTLAADQNGGSLQIDGRATEVALPALFKTPVGVQGISGLLVWRITADAIHVLSDNVKLQTSFLEGQSRFELDWPRNGDSPGIDLTATAVASDARSVVPMLPLNVFPAPVADWLDRAILAGRVPRADFKLSGPLRKFPFAGDEGVFNIDIDVRDGALDYADGWPRISDINARIVFDGVSLTSRRNSGRVGRINFIDSDVQIADLREGLLEVRDQQSVPVNAALDFLQHSPIAAEIGPVIDKVTGVGAVNADLQLALSVLHPTEYELEIVIETNGMNLGMTNLDWGLSELNGMVTIRNKHFHANGLTATLLGEPVMLDLFPAGDSSSLYGQFIRISGRTPIERWMQTLSVPFVERVNGPVDWNALALIPQRQEDVRPPVHIIVRTDLLGAQSLMPDPLAKSFDEVRALELDIAFPDEGRLEVSGRLRPNLTWAFELESAEEDWRIARGAVHAGSAKAIVPAGDGVEISGHLNFLIFEDWLALTDDDEDGTETAELDWQETWRAAILDIDRFSAFGWDFSDVQLEALQDALNWQIMMDGPAAAGQITVPLDLDSGRPIELNMARLELIDTDPETDSQDDDESADPRAIPSVEVEVEDFVINDMRFGSLSASVRNVAGGVLVEPIRTQAPTFTIEGDAAWLVHPNDDSVRQTRLALSLNGTDIKAVLTALGYDPIIDGESVVASGELTWLGGPSEDFLERADGEFTISMKDGSLLDLDPGGGRILGVLSLASLPRRLSFDFSDVLDEGLGFDTFKGDFTLDDGNAYTCNLGMEGSVADMGVVGRAGFAARDYDQLAVVRPHMSNLLAVGGVVVGGPVAGAAMLLFSQVFHKPLSTLGESYYSVSGSWDDPTVEQIRGNDLDVAPLRNCEKFLSDAITESLKE